jgi:multidrug resistance protein, MATE family
MSFITKKSFKEESKHIFKLGLPVAVAQLGIIVQGLADTIMLGHHSSQELAAAGFVNAMFLMGILLSLGFSMGAISQIGRLYFLNDTPKMVSVLKSSLIANFKQVMLITVFMSSLVFLLPHLGQPVELLPMMKIYLLILLPSLPLYFIINGGRQFFDSINQTKVAMWTMIIGNLWNVIFNWFLIFGKCGFPEMGITGAAWATLSSRIIMALIFILVFVFNKRYKKYRLVWHSCKSTKEDIRLLRKLGWPMAVQLGLESASWSLCSIFLGWIGTNALAAHQVMVNVSGVIFMFYVGVGEAISIRVSNYKGINDMVRVRNVSNTGFLLIMMIGVVLSIAMWVFRNSIGFIFTDDEGVAITVSTMILPMILYQFGDGLQVTYSNTLRGLGDAFKLMKYSLIAYLIISLPLSYLFGIVLNGGAAGVWMAFPFGLTTAGILYYRRFRKISLIPGT